MNAPPRVIVPSQPFHVEDIAPGVRLQRLYPGGMAGPTGEVGNDIPGGQTWSEIVMLGNGQDGFIMGVPDIRMPPNQLWTMHWHDCWTVVVIVGRELAVTGLRSIASAGGQVLDASSFGKVKALIQNIAIGALLFHYETLGLDANRVGLGFLCVATVLTLGSGYAYFAEYFRGLRAAPSGASK